MQPQTPKPARWDREGAGVREPAGMHWPTAGARHGLGQAGGSLTWRTEEGSPQGSLSTHTCRDEHGGDGERGEQPARKAEAWRPWPTCWNCHQMEVWREQHSLHLFRCKEGSQALSAEAPTLMGGKAKCSHSSPGARFEGCILGSPRDSTGKESACNAGDLGSIPGLGSSPGEGKGYPLQSSGLENFMDCVVGHDWVTFTFTIVAERERKHGFMNLALSGRIEVKDTSIHL